MDIFSHGLWGAAAFKAWNKRRPPEKKPFHIWQAAFWGVFPDLFAFTIPFVWIIGSLIFGHLSVNDIPRPEETEPPASQNFALRIAPQLYQISHSMVVFLLVFFIVWGIRKFFLKRSGPVWELGGWLLHVLADIPTHSYRFYPTPAFWPISGWKFDGFPWATPWFLILNYALLILVFFLLREKQK